MSQLDILSPAMPQPLELPLVPVFLFTTPTHWFAAFAAHFLSLTFLEGPAMSAQGAVLIWLFSMLPDLIDNPESRPGMVFHALVKTLTGGKLELGRYVEHRGFWHSISALALLSGLLFLIYPKAVPYLLLGMGSHIYIDAAQRKGINLFGFGDWRGRLFRKRDIPSGRQEEFFFLAATLPIILVGIWIVSEGGTKILICKYLGTLECSIRTLHGCRKDGSGCILEVEAIPRQPGGSNVLSGMFHEPEAIGFARIILWINDVPYSLGHSAEDNYLAGRNSYIRRGPPTKACLFGFKLEHQVLGSIQNLVEIPSIDYSFSGHARLKEPVGVKVFPNRFNSILGSGKELTFRLARLPDIKAYGLEHALVEQAEMELLYYVSKSEPCRWKPPEQQAAYGTYTQYFSIPEPVSLLIDKGAVLKAGSLIAINKSIDEKVRLLERELATSQSQLERRRKALLYHRQRYLVEERKLSREIQAIRQRVAKLKRLHAAKASYLLSSSGYTSQKSQLRVDASELETSAKRITESLLEAQEKELKRAEERLERIDDAYQRDLRAFEDASENHSLKKEKLSAEIATLKQKQHVRASVSGVVMDIEKSTHDGILKAKVLILVRNDSGNPARQGAK